MTAGPSSLRAHLLQFATQSGGNLLIQIVMMTSLLAVWPRSRNASAWYDRYDRWAEFIESSSSTVCDAKWRQLVDSDRNDDVTPRGVATLAERQRLVRPL